MSLRISSCSSLVVLGLVAVSTAWAQSPAAADSAEAANEKAIAVVDFDHNQKLDKNEIYWWLLGQLRTNSVDFSLPLQPAMTYRQAMALLTSDQQTTFQVYLLELNPATGHDFPYTYSEVAKVKDFFLKTLPPASPPATPPSGGASNPSSAPPAPTISKAAPGRYYLRRTLAKIPSAGAADSLSSDDASGSGFMADAALLSYGVAKGGGHEVIATGALGYSLPIPKAPEGDLLASLEFNRINFAGAGQPATVSPRFSAETSVANLGASFNWYFKTVLPGVDDFGTTVRVGAYLDSDWDFKSKVPKGQVDISFYRKKYGLGVPKTANSLLYYELDATLHADYGYIAETGPWLTTGKKGDHPAHVGPNLSLTLYPLPQSKYLAATPISLVFTYLDYSKLSEVSAHVRSTTAALNWYIKKPTKTVSSAGDALSQAGIAITVSYIDQKNVDNAKNDDSTLVGLGVGF